MSNVKEKANYPPKYKKKIDLFLAFQRKAKMELEHIGLIGAAFVTKEDVFVEKVYQTEISYLSLSFSIDIFYHLKIYLIISIRKQIHPPPFCFG